MTKHWPTLYIKTKTGAIQFWTISVIDPGPLAPPTVMIEHGQVGTDSPQKASDVITSGKSQGKKNATTPLEQATKEAESKWLKQKKLGYVETQEAAENDERDAIIEGGIDPMLAHHYMDVIYDLRKGHKGEVHYVKTSASDKITLPCKGQPKLDGIRCTAIFNFDGKVSLWSRTRKRILSCPHIERELERRFVGIPALTVIDGELYNHAYKRDFEKIASAVRKNKPSPEAELVQYHIYDAKLQANFGARRKVIREFLYDGNGKPISQILIPVETFDITCEAEIVPLFEKLVAAGYEGLMLRNTESPYIGDRSYDLQKMKPFQDDEFKIVGFMDAKGKFVEALAKFICVTVEGNEFEATMIGEIPVLKAMWKDRESYIGKILTVRYQGFTGKKRVPRFAKGHSVRDYE